jgi:[protein-PII] uridylyltransferase
VISSPTAAMHAGQGRGGAAGVRAGRSPDGYLDERSRLLRRPGPPSRARRGELVQATEAWLGRLHGTAPRSGARVALVAVGSLARRELGPCSDLDLVLLHSGGDVAQVAQHVWYAVWDTGMALDHSVRTVAECREVAGEDLTAAVGLLDARHVAGDPTLATELRATLFTDWRASAASRLPRLHAAAQARASGAGQLAYLLEPDLKEAHGGLRDITALRAVAASWVTDWPHELIGSALAVLLDVRDAVHRATGRPGDRLLLQDQDAVAAMLGCLDADVLMRRVAEAGRAVAYAEEVTWRRVERELTARRRRSRREVRSAPQRRARAELDDGVVAYDGEVHLGADVNPQRDPALLLRAAAAAAQAGLPLSPSAVERLAAESASLPVPWPAQARDALVRLLGAGPAAVPVLEALDRLRLTERLIPDWGRLRSRSQRNALHRWTVDRHCVEAAAEAAALVRRVRRPDLLLVAALLHDVGKGWPGDHCTTGALIARATVARMGFPAQDVAIVELLVQQHLLLAEVAARRDLEDPATVAGVLRVVGNPDALDLLHALTEADARATGPGAWSSWRARLVRDLVGRTHAALAGARAGALPTLQRQARDPDVVAVLAAGEPVVTVRRGEELPDRGWTVTVARPEHPDLLAAVAGVLALHKLDVRTARGERAHGLAVTRIEAVPRGGDIDDPSVVVETLRRALENLEGASGPNGESVADGPGTGASAQLIRALACRDAARPPRRAVAVAPPRVDVVPDASATATVLEVRAHDRPGLLYDVAAAIAASGVSVRSLAADTLGAEAVDVFYVVDETGAALPPAEAGRVARAVSAALAGQ